MRRIFFLAICVLTSSAGAEVVTTRSGEHADYTRLVFYYPQRATWRFEEQRQKAVLSFDNAVTNIDVSDVFAYIPRDRLRDIDLDRSGTQATLEFACDCDARAWQYGDGIMVVDIHGDGTDTPQVSNPQRFRYTLSDTETREQFSGWSHPTAASPAPTNNAVSDPGAYAFGMGLASRTRASSPNQTRPRPAPSAAEERTPANESTSEEAPAQRLATQDDMLGLFRRERVAEAQERLVQQIIRGVAQGSLQADFDPTLYMPETSSTPMAEPIETEMVSLSPQSGEDDDGPPEAPSGELPLRAETTIDRDSAIAEEALRARGCVPASDLNFTGMVAADRFSAALAEARANQARANGSERIDADESLALTYMYWGFGAEAVQTVARSGIADRRRNQLIAQAEIIDSGHAANPLGLAAHPGCDGPAAFWALMAPETWPGGVRINPQSVLATFNALPPHLRRHLGQKLVERLIKADAVDVAQEVQRILLREQPQPGPALQLSSARIAVAGGDAEISEEELASIARSGSDEAALALLDLTDLMLGRDELIAEDLVELLAAYAFENRGTTLGERLQGNRALALARDGQIQTALGIMDNELDGSDHLDATRERMYALATDHGDDEAFLRLALSRAKADLERLDDETANMVARRLLSLGFPDQAMYFLEPETTGPPAIARQILRAESALQLKRPGDVEIHLLGVENQTATRLRAEARAMLADHDHAYEAFSALGEQQQAERQAVLGRDWQRLTGSEDEVLRRAAEVLAPAETPDPEPGLPTLAGTRALIEGSEDTRDALADLILRYAPRDEL